MPPTIYYGEIRTRAQYGHFMDLLISNLMGPSKLVNLNVSPEGLRTVGQENLDLIFKKARMASIHFENPSMYMAHFFAEKPGRWEAIKRNFRVPVGELNGWVKDCSLPDVGSGEGRGYIARHEVPGYDRIATLIKNADDWVRNPPLFKK